MKKLPASQIPAETITLLVVDSNQEDYQSLLAILNSADWRVHRASSFREATTLLHESVPDLVLCEKDLPDGTWKDVFLAAGGQTGCPAVVVVSREPDERLWAEVLNLGAHDMLLKPFDASEVRRMIRCACHRDMPVRTAAVAAA